ncbi:polysaccharide biosynthesis/export family protein [Acuticoccus kandeliae]|uniref:polysaccharide biosynthesis/export family protein n=1 Tax=Acuticoccus kandeliae TaxID=2073160 RepID=UPI000D3E4A84|nr:polysaccharide biosynthesis/export family protein [Acuticoccus kandeliae]
MLRLAVLAVLFVLSACATQPVEAPCAPASGACPVYKAPEDARGACAPACAAPATVPTPAIPSGFQPWAEGYEEALRFVVGDQLQITLPFYDDEDVTTTVAPDGNIYVGLVGKVAAAGRTPDALAADLKSRYARYLRFPEVGVVPTSFGSRQVFVGGEVDKPGAYPLRGPTGALEAVYEAGGIKDTGEPKNVILIRRGPNDLPMMRFLDLNSFAKDGTPTENTLLKPFDIVVVPKSQIARINLFIQQYIEGVVPFNHNFSYVLFDAGK